MVTRRVSSQAVLCIFLLIVAIFTNVKTGYSAIKVSLLAETEMATISGGACACRDCTTVYSSINECYHLNNEGNEDCNTNKCIYTELATGSCTQQSGGTCKMVQTSPPEPMDLRHVRYKNPCNSTIDWHIWATTWIASYCGSSDCGLQIEHRGKCDTSSCLGDDIETDFEHFRYSCVTNCP